jgi:hypothetical protein
MAHEITGRPPATLQKIIRISAFLVGAVSIFWLTIEDVGTTFIFFLATCICFLGLLKISTAHSLGKARLILKLAAGGIAGAAIGPAMIGLMILKIGLHSHGTPDFTPNEILQVLRNIPFWTISGVLITLGVHLFQITKSS